MNDPPGQVITFSDKLQPLFEPHRFKVLYGGRDGKKCLALGTKVIMFDGTLRAVEDVRVGDQLMGPDSQPRLVLDTTRGNGQLYRVRQTSGLTYTVNDAHILSLKKSKSAKTDLRIQPNGNPRSPNGRYPSYPDITNIGVTQLITMSRRWRANFRGYRAGVIHFDKQAVLIDPYLLGVWLGDGTARELRITSADHEVIEYLQEYAKLYGGICSLCVKSKTPAIDIGLYLKKGRTNVFWDGFKAYGLPLNKHIPQVYISNSEEVRLALLAGLLDTDGCAAKHGYTITQVNERLARQIKYLADTLGFRTKFARCNTYCTHKGVGVSGVAYRLWISGDVWRIPCRVARKRYRQEESRKVKDWRLSELSVERCDDGEWAGFSLDGDHLFLLEDGTVTHNSWSIARALIILASQKPLRILCCREIQNSLKESVHKLLADQIEALGLGDHFQVMENEIRGKYVQSQVIYTGLAKQTKESMKSYEGIDIAWIEEAANVSARSLDILEPTLRKPGSEIWISFNPGLDTDEVYVRFVLNPPKEAVVILMNWRDNEHTSAESELARRTMKERSEEEYEHIYEGKLRSAIIGAVYAREVTDLVSGGRFAPCPYDPRLKVHTIWDLGWSGSCTIHLVQSDLSAIRIIGYLEGRSMRTDEWGALLKAMPLNWGWDWLPHDGYHPRGQTGLMDSDVLKNMGRQVRAQNDSIPGPFVINEESGVRQSRQLFPRLYVHNSDGRELLPAMYRDNPQQEWKGLTHWSTARLVECWKRFRYNTPAHGEPSRPVEDEYKHACDGTRYLSLVAHRLSNEDQSSGRRRPIDMGVKHDPGMGALG